MNAEQKLIVDRFSRSYGFYNDIETTPLKYEVKTSKNKDRSGRRQRGVTPLYEILADLSKRAKTHIRENANSVHCKVENRTYVIPKPTYDNKLINDCWQSINTIVKLINKIKHSNCIDYVSENASLTDEQRSSLRLFLDNYVKCVDNPELLPGYQIAKEHNCVYKKAHGWERPYVDSLNNFIHHTRHGKIVDQTTGFAKKIKQHDTFTRTEAIAQSALNASDSKYNTLQVVPTRSVDATARFLKARGVLFKRDMSYGRPRLLITQEQRKNIPAEHEDNVATSSLPNKRVIVEREHSTGRVRGGRHKNERFSKYEEDESMHRFSREQLSGSHGEYTDEDDVDARPEGIRPASDLLEWYMSINDKELASNLFKLMYVDTRYIGEDGLMRVVVGNRSKQAFVRWELTETQYTILLLVDYTKPKCVAAVLTGLYKYSGILSALIVNILKVYEVVLHHLLHPRNREHYCKILGGFSNADIVQTLNMYMDPSPLREVVNYWIRYLVLASTEKMRVAKHQVLNSIKRLGIARANGDLDIIHFVNRYSTDITVSLGGQFETLLNCYGKRDLVIPVRTMRARGISMSVSGYGDYIHSYPRCLLTKVRKHPTVSLLRRSLLAGDGISALKYVTELRHLPKPVSSLMFKYLSPYDKQFELMFFRNYYGELDESGDLDKINALNELASTLNGVNGEATNSDDVNPLIDDDWFDDSPIEQGLLRQSVEARVRANQEVLDAIVAYVRAEQLARESMPIRCTMTKKKWLVLLASICVLIILLGLWEGFVVTYLAKHTYQWLSYNGVIDRNCCHNDSFPCCMTLNGNNGEFTNDDDLDNITFGDFTPKDFARVKKEAKNKHFRRKTSQVRNDENDQEKKPRGKPKPSISDKGMAMLQANHKHDEETTIPISIENELDLFEGKVPVVVRSTVDPSYELSEGKYLYVNGVCAMRQALTDLEKQNTVDAGTEKLVSSINGNNRAYVQYDKEGKPTRDNTLKFSAVEFLTLFTLSFTLTNVHRRILVFKPMFDWLVKQYTPAEINESVFKTGLHKCYNQTLWFGLPNEAVDNVVQAFVDFKHHQLLHFKRLGLAGPSVPYIHDTLNDINNYSKMIDEYENNCMLRETAVLTTPDHSYFVRMDVKIRVFGVDNLNVIMNDGTSMPYDLAVKRQYRGFRLDPSFIDLTGWNPSWWNTQFIRFVGRTTQNFVTYDKHILNILHAMKRIVGAKEDDTITEDYYNIGAWRVFGVVARHMRWNEYDNYLAFLKIAKLEEVKYEDMFLFEELEYIRPKVYRTVNRVKHHFRVSLSRGVVNYYNPFMGVIIDDGHNLFDETVPLVCQIEDANGFPRVSMRDYTHTEDIVLESYIELRDKVKYTLPSIFTLWSQMIKLTGTLILTYVMGMLYCIYDVYTAREYMKDAKHAKKALRKMMVEGEYRINPDSILGDALQAHIKREYAKPSKPGRLYVSYGTGAMYASEVPEIIKHCINGTYTSFYGYWESNIKIFAKREKDDLDKFFNDYILRSHQQSVNVGIYSDDSVYIIKDQNGQLQLFNVDISSCDSSQREGVFGMVYGLIAMINPGTARALLSQCAQPIVAQDPKDSNRRIIMTVDGFFEGSGTVLTTLLNHVASFLIAKVFAHYYSRSKDRSLAAITRLISQSARLVGHKVSIQHCKVVEKLQFLKYSPMYTTCGRLMAVRNEACILRSLGTVEQDLTAQNCNIAQSTWNLMTWEQRADYFIGAVIEGLKNEPETPIISALRHRFPVKGTGSLQVAYLMQERSEDNSKLTIALSSYLKRYECTESDIAFLQDQIRRSKFGWSYASQAVSVMMNTDYDVPYL